MTRQSMKKQANLKLEGESMIELIILAVFVLGLLICLSLNGPLLAALIFGYFLFAGYAVFRRHSIIQILQYSINGIATVKNILMTFILIGMITAIWRACGTIPYIVYHATAFCSPQIMIFITFLLCCLVSILTGTAFGTAATVGVICMTMTNSMEISPLLSGGAVLAGSYFGDRCSPMSTSALLVSELTQTNIFRNIRNMVRTGLIPFLLSSVIYLVAGYSYRNRTIETSVRNIFTDSFQLTVWMLIPAIVVIVFSLLRMNVKITMTASIICGCLIMIFLEHQPVSMLIHTAVFGYQADAPALAALLNGGGILSMTKVFCVVCLSSCYAGIFKATGFLDGIRSHILHLSQITGVYGCIFFTSLLTAMATCNQSLSIMLTHQLCQKLEKESEDLALHLEDTAVVLAPLIPWSIAGAVPLQAVGAPTSAICAACFLYLLPFYRLLRSFCKKTF